jgi:hypothetical protein
MLNLIVWNLTIDKMMVIAKEWKYLAAISIFLVTL